jgi:hypothetical protein
MLNRILLIITPGKGATWLAAGMAMIAFLLGILELSTRDFVSARAHMNLSLGIVAALMLLKYLSLRATYQIAEDAQARIRAHLIRATQARVVSEAEAELSPEEARKQERQQMLELSGQLRAALSNIKPDTPMYAKYNATIEWIERVMQRGS